MDANGSNKSNYKNYIMTLPHPKGMWNQWGVSNPYMILRVQVWYLYNHPNFN